jgi:hypothetical protein
MWEFYLALCEVGFRYRTNVVLQMQLTKRLDMVPITRDYMFDWERHGRIAARREIGDTVTLWPQVAGALVWHAISNDGIAVNPLLSYGAGGLQRTRATRASASGLHGL